jgi:hypothetical protein
VVDDVPPRRTRAGRPRHPSGIAEGTASAQRFVDERIQSEIDDVLVNGPPWNTRIALRIHDYISDPDGDPDVYNNRVVAMLDVRWGRLVRWEDDEDTERVTAWDRRHKAEDVTAG